MSLESLGDGFTCTSMLPPCVLNYLTGDLLELDIKRDPAWGNYKVIFLNYSRQYKRKITLAFNSLDKINHFKKQAKKMLSKIKAPYEIIDAQFFFRPDINTMGLKIVVRFENQDDWMKYRLEYETRTT